MIDKIKPEFPDPLIPNNAKLKYIGAGVSVVFLLIIALLLFCTFSKRDLSISSDFGKRYSQIRTRIRTTVRTIRRPR